MTRALFKGLLLFFGIYFLVSLIRFNTPVFYGGFGPGPGYWLGPFFMNNFFWIVLVFVAACYFSSGRSQKGHTRKQKRAEKRSVEPDLRVINDKLDDLNERLSTFQDQEKEIGDLKARIIALEKVVSDRRYQLDEKFRNL